MITIHELLIWYNGAKGELFPVYFPAQDIRSHEIMQHDHWQTPVYAWSISQIEKEWKYARTDERGEVVAYGVFETSEELVAFAYEDLKTFANEG